MSWLSKIFDFGKKVIGGVKRGIEFGTGLFRKGKQTYQNIRSKITDLPIVGAVADRIISDVERKADTYVKEKTGIGMSDINRGVDIAERVGRVLPR